MSHIAGPTPKAAGERTALIHARFLEQAKASPDSLAVASVEGDLSYGRLAALSARLAGRIKDLADGGVVAILARRDARTIVAALACARAGAPFVILDLAYPEARLRQMIGICRPSLLLLGEGAPAPDLSNTGLPVEPVSLAGPVIAFEAPLISPDDPAYLLFTSGSTGAPKCVAVSHRPLVNFVAWQERTFGLGASDRFTQLSGLSHDPILRDIFAPLSLGASIHIPSQDTLTAPGALYAWFAKVQPTVTHLTPPLGLLLTAVGTARKPLSALRYAFFGGDVLRRQLTQALGALAPACESVNFYGATETPQAAAFYRVPADPGDERLPIGRGIDGFEVELAPDGEVVVRSRFLTLGYVQDGVLPAGGAETYRTGDIGTLNANSELVIHGRRDDQVKVRGHRIEMSEITAAAMAEGDLAQAVTLNLGDSDDPQLVCFVQARDSLALDGPAIRRRLAERLPCYMLPETVVVLQAMPLLPNGKIDRSALVAGQLKRLRAVVTPEPAVALSPTEQTLVTGWQEFFPRRPVGPNASFATLGGDSLSYVTVYLATEQVLGVVPDNWTNMTIRELAAVASAGAKRSMFARIESAIVLRALAICAVVASHFGLLFTGGSATSALLWVSGFIFGGLQLRQAEHQRSALPIGRLILSLLLPVMAYTVADSALQWLKGDPIRLSSILLYVDLTDLTGAATEGPNAYGGHDYLMWYIHCVFHILLIFAALFVGAKYLLRARRPALAATIGAIAIGIVGRFVAPLLAGDFAHPQVDPLSYFNHAPTTHIATFGLAALAGLTPDLRKSWFMAAVGLFVCASVPIYGAADAIAIAPVAATLLFWPRLAAPRLLSLPIHLIAGASLFIYLLHFKVLTAWQVLAEGPLPVVFVFAIVAGVVAWRAWNFGLQAFAKAQDAILRIGARTVLAWMPSSAAAIATKQPG